MKTVAIFFTFDPSLGNSLTGEFKYLNSIFENIIILK